MLQNLSVDYSLQIPITFRLHNNSSIIDYGIPKANGYTLDTNLYFPPMNCIKSSENNFEKWLLGNGLYLTFITRPIINILGLSTAFLWWYHADYN